MHLCEAGAFVDITVSVSHISRLIMSEPATTNVPPAAPAPEKDERDSREPQVDFGNGEDERDPEEVSNPHDEGH